mgnify:CR=1 FL=1
MKVQIPGILLAAFLGFAAFFLSGFTPSFLNSYLLALLLGMFLVPLTNKVSIFDPGIDLSAAKLLELSVIVMAFGMDYKAIGAIGAKDFVVIVKATTIIKSLFIFIILYI